MPSPSRDTRSLVLSNTVFYAMALIAGWYYAKLRWAFTGEYEPVTLELLIQGKAEIPFQYRNLVPWLVRLVSGLSLPYLDSALKVFYAAEIAFSFALIVAYRHYLSLFIRDYKLSCLLSFMILLILPFNYVYSNNYDMHFDAALPAALFLEHYQYNIYYPYDTPSVMFFTLGLVLIRTRLWALYYPLFALATLNRETSCFLAFVYLFTAWGAERKGAIALHCAAQFVLWASIKYWMHAAFPSNPGEGLFGLKPLYNLEYLLNVERIPFLMSSLGFMLVPVVLMYGRIDDRFVRRSVLVAAPYYVGMVLVATIYELRDYGELTPVVLTALLLIVRNLFAAGASDSRPAS